MKRAPACSLFAIVLCTTFSAAGEDAPPAAGAAAVEAPPDEPPAPAPDPETQALEQQLDQREQQLDRQQQQLDRQQERLDAMSQRLDELSAEQAAARADSEAQSLLAEVAAEEDYAAPQLLKLYGFMDFGLQRTWVSERSQLNGVLPTAANTFVLGNVNVFIDAQPHDDWRGLLEVRFTNLPHGAETLGNTFTGTGYSRVDTTTTDFTSPSFRGSVVVGSVIIERAWAEWTASDAFRLRTGYFFTPFGIWNLDHGTPTLISLALPGAIADQFFPQRQLGVHALGSTYTGNGWELGYHAYVSNGRTPSQVDFTDDKALGGRVFAASGGNVKARFGLSGYYGTMTDVEKSITSIDPFEVTTTETVALTEWALGADAALDVDELRVRSEVTMRRMDFEEGKRLNFLPDHHGWNAYLLGAYQLPWLGLEPYGYFEFIHLPSIFGDTVFVPSVGVNVHFTPMVQLKNQAAYAMFYDLSTDESRTPSDNNTFSLASRLVIAF